jgi:galactokinase
MKDQLTAQFAQKFDNTNLEQLQFFFCPGRVNLLGEHTDYNGGWVLPAAISMGIYAVLRPRTDATVHLASTLFEQSVAVDLNQPIAYHADHQWANYPKGVMQQLQAKGTQLKGCDILFVNDLPLGSGLSSSAALEVLTAYVFETLAGHTITETDRVAMAQLTQTAENNFIGVSCGIMDMFAVALGKAQHAIQLHCDTLAYSYQPLSLGDYQLVIINTNKPRKLVESKYNERQAECQQAVQLISAHAPIANLSEATIAQIEAYITNETIARRARHVVTENQRVQQAAQCLQQQDIEDFGALMDASHQSLKVDYEVSGIELDTAVAIARALEGCIGARMTGAGFGGCVLALVQKNKVEAFTQALTEKYSQTIGYTPTCYPVLVGDGVGKL